MPYFFYSDPKTCKGRHTQAELYRLNQTSPDPRSPASTWNYFTFADCETSRLLHARSSSVSLTPLLFRANYFSAFFFLSFFLSFLPLHTSHIYPRSKCLVYCSVTLQFTRNTSNHQGLEKLGEYFLVCNSRLIYIINLHWICYENRSSRVSTASVIGFASFSCV